MLLFSLYASLIKHVTPPHTSGLLGSRCEAFGVGCDVTCALSWEVADSQENASSFLKSHKTTVLQSCAVQRAPAAPPPSDTTDARLLPSRSGRPELAGQLCMWVPLSIRGLKRALGS